jgi:hypothetical protein
MDTTLVKTNGVYLKHTYDSLKLNSSRYSFYRFFDNGRVFISCIECSQPDFNNLEFAFYGYYRVDSNIIKIETYAPWVGYYYEYLKVNNDKITYIGSAIRYRLYKEDFISARPITYTFYKNDVTSKSNW